MKILILTGRFGLGHLSAANAIKAHIDSRIPGCQTSVVDFLQYASCEIIYKAFALLVRKGESVFNHLYNLCDSDGGRFGIPFKLICFSFFSRILEEHKPDLIISTLPFTSQLAGRYKKKKGSSFSLATWVTDTALHGEWVAPATDFYFVACSRVRDSLIEAGIPESRIFVSGVPVRGEFSPAPDTGHAHIDGLRRLLVLGGGFGLICEDVGLYRQLNELEGVKTTVICGCNGKMFSALDGRFENVHAVGFVHDMERYMRESDLALGKPGGVTLFEAIASNLPFLSLQPFLAQEKANAQYVESSGIGGVLSGPVGDCVPQIGHMLRDDLVLAAARERMAAIESGLDKDALARVIASLMQGGVAVA